MVSRLKNTTYFGPILLFSSLFISLNLSLADQNLITRCMNDFSLIDQKTLQFQAFQPGRLSIRNWFSQQSSTQIKDHLPLPSKINMHAEAIKNPAAQKLIRKLIDRMNLEHGALHAINDSLHEMERQLSTIIRELESEPISIRNTFEQMIARKISPVKLELSETEQQEFEQILSHYRGRTLQSKPLLHSDLLQEEIKQQMIDFRFFNQARKGGSLVERPIKYHASRYFYAVKDIQKLANEAAQLFREISEQHFITEEVILANFMTDLDKFNRHLSTHDASLKLFSKFIDTNNVDLTPKNQLKKIKMIREHLDQWLNRHVQNEDMLEYDTIFGAQETEQILSSKEGIFATDGARLKTRWGITRKGFGSVNEYLLKALNSEKVFF